MDASLLWSNMELMEMSRPPMTLMMWALNSPLSMSATFTRVKTFVAAGIFSKSLQRIQGGSEGVRKTDRRVKKEDIEKKENKGENRRG